MSTLQPSQELRQHIHLVRGHRVLLQNDLARLYGATPTRVIDHAQRFPGELCFPLENPELAYVKDPPEDAREPVYGFTEHGALALAYVLDSPKAVAMSIHVMRAFVQLRQDRTFLRSYANSFI
jgi:hypothetical protein